MEEAAQNHAIHCTFPYTTNANEQVVKQSTECSAQVLDHLLVIIGVTEKCSTKM